MNTTPIIFLTLIAVVRSRVATTTDRSIEEQCEEEGPAVYCEEPLRASLCNAEEFCKEYMRKSACEKGPEVFCATKITARSCKKEEYCVTWLDDSITARKMTPVTSTLNPRYEMYVPGFRFRTPKPSQHAK